MGLYELTLQASYYGQLIVNRFTYEGSGTPAAVSMSFALASAFGCVQSGGLPTFPVGSVMEAIAMTQRQEVNYVQYIVKNLYSTTDFWESPFNALSDGYNTGAGTAASPVLAVGYKSSRPRSDIGRGYKRFPGIEEGQMAAGGQIETAFLTGNVTACAAAMGDTLEYDDSGAVLTFTPCILKKEKYVAPSGKNAYRYFATQTEQEANAAIGVTWTPYDTVRTQRSRQYGHGA